MKRALVLSAVLVVIASVRGFAATASSVSQYGITWQFDHSYTVGQFANGDWWVLGPVTITSITPAYRTRDFWDYTTAKTKGVVFKKINGWQVNPTSLGNQGFDETNFEFDSTLVPDLPYLALPGQSIVKAISDTNPAHRANTPGPDPVTGDPSPLWTAAVLTVVGAVPPDSGSTVFRPPYVDANKPYYSITGVST
jgi:hypothetical protein